MTPRIETDGHVPDSKVAKPYDPTPRERRAVEASAATRQARPPVPPLKITATEPSTQVVSVAHPDQAFGEEVLASALGSAEPTFMRGLLLQLANVANITRTDREEQLNFILSMVLGVEPRDPIETMIASQMAAIHNALMDTARIFNGITTIEEQDSTSNALNKLARTFAIQVDTLKRYRTGGEQRVVVQHMNISEGGQAIVGNVTVAGRGGTINRRQPHDQRVSLPEGAALHRDCEADATAVSVPGRARLDRVPVSWCRGWRAQRVAQRRVSDWASHGRGGGGTACIA
jgi:hypothetical protein